MPPFCTTSSEGQCRTPVKGVGGKMSTTITNNSIADGSFVGSDGGSKAFNKTTAVVDGGDVSILESIGVGDGHTNGTHKEAIDENNDASKVTTPSTSNKRSSKKNAKQQREEDKALTLTIKVEALIDAAMYEVTVDAYRGIFGDQSDEESLIDTDTDIDVDMDADESDDGKEAAGAVAREQERRRQKKVTSANHSNCKFYACYGQMDKNKMNQSDHNYRSQNYDTISENNCIENIASCPCIQKWIEKAMSDFNPKPKSHGKNRKSKDSGNDESNANGNDNNGSRRSSRLHKASIISDVTKKTCETPANSAADNDIVMLDTGHDTTTRGSTLNGSLVMECSKFESICTSGKVAKKNQFDNFKVSKENSSNDKVLDPACATNDQNDGSLVMDSDHIHLSESKSNITCNVCEENDGSPIVHLDNEEAEAKNGKNNEAGPYSENTPPIEDTEIPFSYEIKRPPSFHCPCDYNPLCLASIGGVADEYMNNAILGGQCLKAKFDAEMDEFNRRWEQNITTEELEGRNNSEKLERSFSNVNSRVPTGGKYIDDSDESDDESIFQTKDKELLSRVGKLSYQMNKLYNDESLKGFRFNLDDGTGDKELVDLGKSDGKEFRQHFEVKSMDVRSYLEKVFEVCPEDNSNKNRSKAPNDRAINEIYLEIEKWHKSMSFENFCRETNESTVNFEANSDDKVQNDTALFRHCKPVGLKNLGATCYLNSQLQCLSTNIVFLEGLLSWCTDSANKSSKMIQIISRMQTLLADMVHGSQNIVCTGEFSSSLGLANNEMQDPNEFARLLFDRIQESFQRIDASLPSKSSFTKENSFGLGDLLPQIFEGTCEFNTKCLKCKSISRRNENFMDLVLPIIPPGDKGKKGKSKICVTVQDCLDEYFKPERLKGENKYYCETCRGKFDAERLLALSHMPQVLNLQLARYMYDQSSGSKQKLMDQVLLPRTLNVPQNKIAKNGSKKNKSSSIPYILCAVQNHRGKSALSGHYVAEAMDWATGVWFEYDDEKVTELEDGPTCSYNSDEKLEKKKGTSDAYNLFYVKQSCLRDSIKNKFSVKNDAIVEGVIQKAKVKREKEYKLKLDQQLEKVKIANRMNCRRSGIMKFMFDLGVTPSQSSDAFWVDGKILQRFVSCEDQLEDILGKSYEPILKHKDKLCDCDGHQGLPPREARKGKLLSKQSFEAYLSLLKTEKELLLQDKGVDPKDICSSLCDVVITKNENLKCEKCARKYQLELSEKVEKFKLMKELYYKLENSFDIVNPISDNAEPVYAISRTFVTNFRKFVLKLMKEAVGTGSKTSNAKQVSEIGLDALQMEDLLPWKDNSNNKEEIDPQVNTKILCEHGSSNDVNNRRKVRYVSSAIFSDIKKLFPRAVEVPVKVVDQQIMPCPKCSAIEEYQANLPDKLLKLVESSSCLFCDEDSDEDSYNKIMKKDSTIDRTFFLVHSSDFDNVQKAAKLINKKCPPKPGREISVGKELRAKLEKEFFDSSAHSSNQCGVNSKVNSNINSRWKFQSLICKHQLNRLSYASIQQVIEAKGIHTHNQGAEAVLHYQGPEIEDVNDLIHVLTVKKYLSLVKFIRQLEYFIFWDLDDPKPMKFVSKESFYHFHPKVYIANNRINVCPVSCFEKNSLSSCLLTKQKDKSNSEKQRSPSPPQAEHVLVDDDEPEVALVIASNDNFSYRLYSFDESHSIETIQQLMDKEQKNNEMEEVKPLQQQQQGGVRRSSRKTKKRPASSPISFEVKKTNNLAHLRLYIDEKLGSEIDLINQHLAIYKYYREQEESVVIPLKHESNEKEMIEAADFVKGDPHVELILYSELPQKRSKRGGNNKSKNNSKDQNRELDSEALMADLLRLATSSPSYNSSTSSGNGSSKRKRTEEIGFRGTFLQSSSVPSPMRVFSPSPTPTPPPSTSASTSTPLCTPPHGEKKVLMHTHNEKKNIVYTLQKGHEDEVIDLQDD